MLLDLNKFIEAEELKQITTSNLMIGDKFDPNGLFSNAIFGLFGSSRWRTKHAFIDLRCNVLHPLLYEIADRRCSSLIKFFNGDLSILNNKLVAGNSGEWGIKYFVEELEKVVKIFLDQGQLTNAGATLMRYIVKNRKLALIDKVIVLPPQFRPINIANNRIDLHPINDKYVNMINEAQILSATDVTSKSYKELLFRIQTQVFEAYQILRDMIKGKTGIQRKSLLGKSMDFSARAVIVGDPAIPPDKVGVPFKIALSLFKPFIIYKSTSKYAQRWMDLGIPKPSILTIGNLVNMVKEGKKDLMDPQIISLLLEILKEICTEKVVILKRDPALHRLSLRAFYPTIVFTDSFHINPLLTEGFNADFDGDQMGIYLPLTEAAQREAKEKMLVSQNIWGPGGTSLTLEMKNDVVYGVYCLTADPKSEQVLKEKVSTIDEMNALMLKYSDPAVRINYKGKITTIGRAIVEEIVGVPIDKQYKKKDINGLFAKLALKEDATTIMYKMNDLMQIAMIAPTIIGKSINIDQFQFPEELNEKKEKAFKAENPSDALDALSKDVVQALKKAESMIFDLYDSGGRGKLSNIQTQIVAKGYVEDTDGTVIDKPVKSALNDGLTSAEYVDVSVGGRKGIIDRSQMTAVSGYLTRQMVYCTASVKASERVKDCGTKRYFELNTKDEKVAKSFLGRYTSNGQLIESVDDILGKSVKIRTPLYCTSPEICHKCLGTDVVNKIKANNIGILAAQVLGERGSQLTMQTFHCIHSKILLLFKYNGSVLCTSFEKLWNMMDTEIQYSGSQEEKCVEDLYVWDKDKYTKVNKIIRHPKQEGTEMVMLRTNGGDFIISQDNHPHMLALNERVCTVCKVPYVSVDKKTAQMRCPICNKKMNRNLKNKSNEQYEMVESKEYIKSKYYANTIFPIWQEEKRKPFMEPYLLGMYLAEGSLGFRNGKVAGYRPIEWCISQNKGTIQDKIIKIIQENNYGSGNVGLDGGHITISDTNFAKIIYNNCGRYSYNVCLPSNFIYYSNEDLSKILCGIIDGDGCYVPEKERHYVSIEITSLELIQQIHHILQKFDIKHNITVHSLNSFSKNQSYNVRLYPTIEDKEIFKYSCKLENMEYPKKCTREMYKDLVTYMKPVLFTDDYVYDLETETHTLTANGIWTHNTGGAGTIKNFMSEDSRLANILTQDGNDIITKQKIIITFDEQDIRGVDVNEYLVQIFAIKTESEQIDFILPYDFTIVVPTRDNLIIKDKTYEVLFEENMICGSMKNSSQSITSAIADISKILNSRILVNEALVLKVHELFSTQTFIPMWAIELLASQVARDPENLQFPYRLSGMKKDPVRVPIKQVALLENWKRGAAFENVSNAFHSAILNGTDETIVSSDLDNLLDL